MIVTRPHLSGAYGSPSLARVCEEGGYPRERVRPSHGPPAPVPRDGFLSRQERVGLRGGRMVWRSRSEDRYYTWDPLHGEVEAFNRRGRHVGVLHAYTGVMIGDAVPGRRIDV